ncbi:MAG: aspartate kinase [Clostridium sp.]|nr:aspartate kinase [Clostridium sp.]MCM1547693.1 aspartate kinase [Ruminococcus sp.]
MNVKVVKFGGSSLADAKQITKAAEIIKSDEKRRFVVPSAPGKRFSDDIKVTDMLYACNDLAIENKSIDTAFQNIADRYNGIISELGIELSLDSEFEIIKKNITEKAGGEYAASRGEYLNGIIIAKLLGYEFIDAAEVIVFDKDGSFNNEKTQPKLRERLKNVSSAVIPGFYGADESGIVRTFSRGGSDITGSIIASAVKAEVYENWTDVSGVLVSDPRIVNDPVPISVITYKELRELSYMGATVLHEDAIFPVRAAGIPINIKNTNRPEDHGTMIVSEVGEDDATKYTITGIAGKKGFAAINIEKAMMNSELGFCRKVLAILEDNGISIEHMPSGIDTLSLIFPYSDIEGKEDEVVAKIRKAVSPDHIEIERGIAMLAVVGRGMRRTRGTAARIFASMAHARINVKMIDQGSSELNVIIGIGEDDFDEAIRRIYDMFVNSVK